MTTEKASYQQKLESLRVEYSRMLPARLDEINAHWALYLTSSGDMTELYRLVHTLSGSGATFGYSLVSETAREIELMFKQLQDGSRPMDDGFVADVQAGLSRLKQAISHPDEAATAESSPKGSPQPRLLADGHDIYWYYSDQQQALRIKTKLLQYGFNVHLFDAVNDLARALERGQASALVFDFYDNHGRFIEQERMLAILEKLRPRVPYICLCPSGEELGVWLAAYRGGAVGCFPRPLDFHQLLEKLDQISAPAGQEPYRLFIVDDDKELVEHMAAILERAGMVVGYETHPARALGPIDDFKPDLILLDLYMPGISGLELARIVRQQKRYISIPIVYISREREVNKHLEALEAGAEDFLLKPVKYKFLYHSLASRMKRYRQLRSYLTRDGLTGMLNHTALQERLGNELLKSAERREQLTLALIDIDDFKALNDRYGHGEGDRLLKSMGILLKRLLGSRAIIGRYGGEEFGVILPDTGVIRAEQILNDIRVHFSEIVHDTYQGSYLKTFSCGLATYPAIGSLINLCDAADRALSNAKISGKNKVVALDPPGQLLYHDDLITLEDEENLELMDVEDAGSADKISIVVVDDDSQVLQHISAVLENKGFKVFQASAGEDGFELVSLHKPALVLIDLLLFPGIHGFELCQKIRQYPELQDIKIILMTAVYKDDRYRREGSDVGADDFIEKPINYPNLLTKIRNLLAR